MTATLLVVTLHSGLAYTKLDIPRLLWGVRDPSSHVAFDLFSWWSMGISVSLFFAISGYFAAEVEVHRGPVEFLKSRFKRVVVPLLAVAPVILPLSFFSWTIGWLATGRAEPREFWRMRFLDPAIMDDLYGPAHLWFLEYLIPMLAIFGIWRKIRLDDQMQKLKIRRELATRAKKVQPSRKSRKQKIRADQASHRSGVSVEVALSERSWLLSRWAPLVLAVPTVLLLLISRQISGIDVILDRHNSFIPGLIRLLYYSAFFACGVGLHRIRGQLDTLAGRGIWWLLASVPVFAVRCYLLPLDWSKSLEGPMALALAASGGLTTCLTLFGLLGLYRKYVSRSTSAIRVIAEASFWIYLVHFPLVGLIQTDLLQVPIPTVAKFAVTLSLTLALGLSSYLVLVRDTRFARFLNGGKARRSVAAHQTANVGSSA